MWGNRLGWMISAGIGVVTIILYAILLIGPGVSSPTNLTKLPGALDPLTLPGNARSLVPAAGGADATDLYQKALDGYHANEAAFAAYNTGGKLNSATFKAIIPTVDLLVKAAESPKGSIFAKNPSAIIKYNPDQAEALKPVDNLGRITIRIGMQYNIAKKPEEAKKYLQAAFALGYSLCNERLIFHELRIGQDLMRSAAANLIKAEPEKAGEYQGLDAEYKKFYENQLKFMSLCNPSDPSAISRNAGDVFNLALNSKERMWRIEAIMMLGHYRYNASQPGDQRGAEKALTALAADTSLDPAVAAAVKVAKDLTSIEHGNSQQMQ